MSKNHLSQTPENEALSIELDKLNAEFLELFSVHKDTTDNEPILYSLYLNKLGFLTFRLFEKKTEYSKVKMKMELIQAAINRNEKPNFKLIEKKLDAQLSDYYKQIAENADNLEIAKSVLLNLLPPEFVTELKELFHTLCKRLHPDLHPNQTEEDKDLFLKVKAAYDLNNLTELKKILLYLESNKEEPVSLLTSDEKQKRIEYLTNSIHSLKEKIQKLLESFPHNLKELISDDEKIAAEQDTIKNQIRFYEKEIKDYEAFIELMTS